MDNLKIERYLNTLEKELQALSALKKSEIVLEVKKHIEEHLNKGQDIDSVLNSLGRADQLGQKYLRDLGYLRKKKSAFGKYFLMTTIAFFLLLFIGAGAIVWKFSPIISVDEKSGRFQFLGGLIDVQASDDGSFFVKSPDSIEFSADESSQGIEDIRIEMQNGFLNIAATSEEKISYKCQADEDFSSLVSVSGQIMAFNWSRKNLSCFMKIPENKNLIVQMRNGTITLNELKNDLRLQLRSGTIMIKPAQADYNYHLSIDKGIIDKFENSNSPKAYKINIDLKRGNISKI